jgi:hypothetical protein
MKTSNVIKYALIGASLPLLAGCVEREVVYRDRPAPPPSQQIVVEDTTPAPPPVQVEVVTEAPGPLEVWFWVPGCWEWRGSWVWAGGHWAERPHRGAIWVRSGWVVRGHGRVWVSGHWR